MRTTLLPFLALALAHFACGGAVDSVPTAGTTSPPASSTEPTPPGSGEVNTGTGVTGNGPGSAKPTDPAESCDLACDEGHSLVQGTIACAKDAACYTRTVCGKTFTCTGAAGLCDEPACLGYTQEVKTCPAGKICETQYLCDRTLICQRTDSQCDGLPACGEQDEQVADATACAKLGARCYSRAGCGERIYCVRAP